MHFWKTCFGHSVNFYLKRWLAVSCTFYTYLWVGFCRRQFLYGPGVGGEVVSCATSILCMRRWALLTCRLRSLVPNRPQNGTGPCPGGWGPLLYDIFKNRIWTGFEKIVWRQRYTILGCLWIFNWLQPEIPIF